MLKLKALLVILALIFFGLLLSFRPKLPQSAWRAELAQAVQEKTHGLRFYDHEQNLLRVIKTATERTEPSHHKQTTSIPLEQVSPFFTQALLCLEDQGFYQHRGVPFQGVLRALWLNLKAQRFVAGGSGITQQVIKIFRGRARGLMSKLKEAYYALALEQIYSKSDILELYLNHVAFGPNLIGLHKASTSYFSVAPHRLSLGQAAYLASLPLAPSRLNPRKNVQTAIPRQRAALSCMHKQNLINTAQYQRALGEVIKINQQTFELTAPHITDSLAYGRLPKIFIPSSSQNSQRISLSIRTHLQERMEQICKRYSSLNHAQGLRQLAAVGLDVESGEVLFWVGSQDYAHPDAGQVDHVLGLRLPGSTLKPFLYALALDHGYRLDQKLPDQALYFKTARGQYKPQNYDHKYRGEVTLMSALAMSLNIPSVYLLNQLGVSLFLDLLRSVGLKSLNQSAEHYGLGLSLGDGEVRLIDLVNAYRIFANQGRYSPWKLIQDNEKGGLEPHVQQNHAQKVISDRAAQAILHTLSSQELRAPTFGQQSSLKLPFASAAKTGTGQGYSNAWTIGLSAKYVVGVWVLPKFGAQLSGGMIAAPLWHELMLALHQDEPAPPFAQNHLSYNDRQVLEQIIHLEQSRHHHLARAQELIEPDHDDLVVDTSTHHSKHHDEQAIKRVNHKQQQAHLQKQEQKLPPTYQLHLLTPPQGAEYRYLPQRAVHDNVIKAEVLIKPDHINRSNLSMQKQGLSYRLQWFLNGNPLSADSAWSKTMWFNPWHDHDGNKRVEHKLCVSLQQKTLSDQDHVSKQAPNKPASKPASEQWFQVTKACHRFTVHPRKY